METDKSSKWVELMKVWAPVLVALVGILGVWVKGQIDISMVRAQAEAAEAKLVKVTDGAKELNKVTALVSEEDRAALNFLLRKVSRLEAEIEFVKKGLPSSLPTGITRMGATLNTVRNSLIAQLGPDEDYEHEDDDSDYDTMDDEPVEQYEVQYHDDSGEPEFKFPSRIRQVF